MSMCRYLVIQVFMVLVLVVMVLDTSLRAKSMLFPSEEDGHDHYSSWDFWMLCYDLLVVIAMPIYIGFRVFTALNSKDAMSGTDVKYLYVLHALLTLN